MMEHCYGAVREAINSKATLNELKAKWPYFYQPRWFLDHFEKLTGIDLGGVLPKSLSEKGTEAISNFIVALLKFLSCRQTHPAVRCL
jgi:hypothetical protein